MRGVFITPPAMYLEKWGFDSLKHLRRFPKTSMVSPHTVCMSIFRHTPVRLDPIAGSCAISILLAQAIKPIHSYFSPWLAFLSLP